MILRSGSRRGLEGAIALLLLAFPIAANAASTTFAAQTAIVNGIGINKNSDLAFGDLMPPAVASTVNVNASGSRSASSSVTLLGGTVSAASFTVRSQGGGSGKFWIQVPATVTLTGSSGGSMTITNMNSTSNISAPTNCVSTSTSAPAGPKSACPSTPYTFTLGGQLNVNANQAPGSYTGTFSVTVTMW